MVLDERYEVNAAIERARAARDAAKEVLKPLRERERQSNELRKDGSTECARAQHACSDARSSLDDIASSQGAGKRSAEEFAAAETTRTQLADELAALLRTYDSPEQQESWRARLDEMLRDHPPTPPLPALSGVLSSPGELRRRFAEEDIAIQESIQRLDPYPQSHFPERWQALYEPRPSISEWRASVLARREEWDDQEHPPHSDEPQRPRDKEKE